MLGIHGTYTEMRGGFRGYIAKIQAATEECPEEAAQFMAEAWRKNVAVDTGSLRASIYVQGHDHSDYDAHLSAARSLNPSMEVVAELARPSRKGAAAVGSAAGHAVHQEFGTVSQPARPAFVPAVEATKRQFPEITRRKLQL